MRAGDRDEAVAVEHTVVDRALNGIWRVVAGPALAGVEGVDAHDVAAPQPTHLANIGSIVRALAQLWPLAAVIWLLAALAHAARGRAAR